MDRAPRARMQDLHASALSTTAKPQACGLEGMSQTLQAFSLKTYLTVSKEKYICLLFEER